MVEARAKKRRGMDVFETGGAIYLQIVEQIKRAVVRGEIRPGEKIMSIKDMAISIGVNPNTVARAYGGLEREEFLVSRRGIGLFVTENKKKIESEKQKLICQYTERFDKEIKELGINVEEVITMLKDFSKERKFRVT